MLRKLALRMAFLSVEDRDWLLSQLSLSDRQRISALISEANEMGLTKDPIVLSNLSQQKIKKEESQGRILKEELSVLPLFWQHLIESHQTDATMKSLPESLMLSVILHARNSLVGNKTEDK